MNYVMSFLIGGLICGLAALIKSLFKLNVGKTTVLFVIIGSILSIYGIYDKIIEIGGAGALLPITSFGNSLTKAAYEGICENGILGLFTNLYSTTSLGISIALVFGFVVAIIFNPKE